MARVIDADAFLEHWNKEYRHRFPCDMYKTAIANFPTVDAVPVVHGRWDTIQQKTVSRLSRCSACGFEKYNIHWCNYCPNCGAKMDLEVE